MIKSIHFLRGQAALLVFFYHVYFILKNYLEINLPIINIFHIGVDIFFVISGFIMVIVINKTKYVNPKYINYFIISRIRRICPQYYIVTLIMFTLYVILLNNPREITYFQLIKSLLFIPYDSAEGIYPVLGVGWTLNYEMFFYVIISINLYLFRDKYIFSVILTILAIVGIGYFYPNVNFIPFKFFSKVIIIEFILGWILALLYLKRISNIDFSVIIFVLGIFIYYINAVNEQYGIYSFLIVFLFLYLNKIHIFNKFFGLKIFTFMGTISYSFYLVHQPILALNAKIFNYLNILNINYIIVIYVIVSFFISVIAACLLDNIVSKIFKY